MNTYLLPSTLAMTFCFANLFHTFTVMAVILLVIYLLVFLPDNSKVLRVCVALICSFASLGFMGAIYPEVTPEDPFIVAMTYCVLIFFFWSISSSGAHSVTAMLLMMAMFPFSVAIKDNLQTLANSMLGVELSATEVLIFMLSLFVVVGSLLIYFSNSELLWDVLKAVMYSLLAVFAIRILAIVIDNENPKEFCCNSDIGEEKNTCPLSFNSGYYIMAWFFIIFRFVMVLYWRDRKEALGKAMKKCSLYYCCCCRYKGDKKVTRSEERALLRDSNLPVPDDFYE